jgi:hypothetical protein
VASIVGGGCSGVQSSDTRHEMHQLEKNGGGAGQVGSDAMELLQGLDDLHHLRNTCFTTAS